MSKKLELLKTLQRVCEMSAEKKSLLARAEEIKDEADTLMTIGIIENDPEILDYIQDRLQYIKGAMKNMLDQSRVLERELSKITEKEEGLSDVFKFNLN